MRFPSSMKKVLWPADSKIIVYNEDHSMHKIVAPRSDYQCDTLAELFDEFEQVYATCKWFPNRRIPVYEKDAEI